MKIIADYHTHTIFSHGKGTIEDNVLEARKKGLKQIAITDHGFAHIGFGVKKKNLIKIKDEINKLRDKFNDIEILLGIEANLTGLDGEIDIPDNLINEFDIILMGFHKAVWPATLKDGYNLFLRNAFDSIMPFENRKLRLMNTEAIVKAINNYPIRIITHPGAKIDIDSRILSQAAARKNVFLEINANHKKISVDYAKTALNEGAFFVISSDAHTPARVGVFDRALKIAEEAGISPHRIINTPEGSEKFNFNSGFFKVT